MKTIRVCAICTLFAVTAVLFCNCSDDSPKKPSQEIVRVDIYKITDGDYLFDKSYKFNYDAKNRLSSAQTEYQDQEIVYTYNASSVAYRWDRKLDEEATSVNRFESELKNGKVNVMTSTNGNYTYFYSGKGYITDVSYAGNQILSYLWGKKGLIINSTPDLYDTEYIYTDVENKYSIDLNALMQLVDSRDGFTAIMNTYGQLAGILGTKYPYILQDIDYNYTYSYDENERLVLIELKPAGLKPEKQTAYWIMLTYEEK